jgi:hypothetical protein
MSEISTIAPIIIGSILISGVIKILTLAPGQSLQGKFGSLGDMTGKTRTEIIAVVNNPTSISALPDGRTLLQWQATGYHIALRFSGEIFDGITHQHIAK